MAHRPVNDPGLIRYVCRVDDCRAFGTARFSFTTEEELVCHWNTFHVAVMPQFTCQHSGCKAVFSANPGSLDRYLSHIEQRRKEEADAGVPLARCHSYEPNERALVIKSNPYYKSPSPQDEVPQRCVIAPPVYRHSQNPGDNIRNIHWAYRRIFERKICQALERPTSADSQKRRRSDASLSRPDESRKRHKSSSSRGGSWQRKDSDKTFTSSRSTHRNPKAGLSFCLGSS